MRHDAVRDGSGHAGHPFVHRRDVHGNARPDLAGATVGPHVQLHELALVLDGAGFGGSHTARTASIVSRSRVAGFSAGAPSQSVRMRRVPVPSPSTKRPPDISSRSSAVTAVSRGERPNAQAIAVPSSMRSVSTAAAASASGPEWLWNSGAQTESKPASSARRAIVDVLALRRELEQEAEVHWRFVSR